MIDRKSDQPDALSGTDKILIGTLWLFAAVALILEPLYYFGCNWNDVNDACNASPYMTVRGAVVVWRIYSQNWDPIFLDIPMWLRVMCTIEVFVFGPLYVITALLLQRRSSWLPLVAYVFSGALFYSTVVYFSMEVIELLAGTNLPMVFLVNIPWSILPVVLSWRVGTLSSLTGSKAKRK